MRKIGGVMTNPKVSDYLPEIFEAMKKRLDEDDKKWGPEWLRRPIRANEEFKDQEIRILGDIMRYYQNWIDNDVPIPWEKIIGNCMIAMIREAHPEMFPEDELTKAKRELAFYADQVTAEVEAHSAKGELVTNSQMKAWPDYEKALERVKALEG
jgi:hypothetical protein